jgi:hypothetical protein
MEWGNGGTFRKVATTGYQVEHILEWQLVTNFFDWMNVEYNGGQSKFDNPKGGVKVDFCEHWKGTWAINWILSGKNSLLQQTTSKMNSFGWRAP